MSRDGRTAPGGRQVSGDRDLLLPALHAVQDAHRLDQPRRAQLHLPAAVCAAGRSVGRRDLLSPVRDRAAAADRRARLRRHRLPAAWRRAICVASSKRAGRDACKRSPCLGQCDRGAGGAGDRAGERLGETFSTPIAPDNSSRGSTSVWHRSERPGSGALEREARCAAIGRVDPHRARRLSSSTAAMPRWRDALEMGAASGDRRSHRVEFAGPRRRRVSRPAASGRRWRAKRRRRITWSATPTSPSPARSRIAC